MAKTECLFSILYAFSLVFLVRGSTEIYGCSHSTNQKGEYFKLFVFGDSYADTGNLGKLLGRNLVHSWFEPYGMTFPKKPAGRFSDGRVLTDYVASTMGIRSPVPYKIRRAGYMLLKYGMNFAVGGSGVFDTGNFQNDLSAQIDEFRHQVKAGVFSKCDIKSSAALVAISGNDYSHLAQLDPAYLIHIDRFMDRLFVQLKKDLKRLSRIGVPKVIITNLHPIQCTPYYTRPTNYTACPEDVAAAVADHNRRVERMAAELNGAGGGNYTTFLALDVNTAISNVLHQVNGAEKIKYPLVPCCEGSSSTSSCGEIDLLGNELYKVCPNPEEHLYWDSVHLTQAGWAAAFEILAPSLRQFLHL